MNINKHNKSSVDFENILTLQQVGSILHVGRVTVSKLLWGGKLRGFKVGRAWRIQGRDLERFMQTQVTAEQETAKISYTIGREKEA